MPTDWMRSWPIGSIATVCGLCAICTGNANLFMQVGVFIIQKFYIIFADLSEYNMLLFNQKLTIIDVSQSVEHDHPNALEFLRIDIGNVTKFFMEKGAAILARKRLFEVNINYFQLKIVHF
jgi:RIO kinase 1